MIAYKLPGGRAYLERIYPNPADPDNPVPGDLATVDRHRDQRGVEDHPATPRGAGGSAGQDVIVDDVCRREPADDAVAGADHLVAADCFTLRNPLTAIVTSDSVFGAMGAHWSDPQTVLSSAPAGALPRAAGRFSFTVALYGGTHGETSNGLGSAVQGPADVNAAMD